MADFINIPTAEPQLSENPLNESISEQPRAESGEVQSQRKHTPVFEARFSDPIIESPAADDTRKVSVTSDEHVTEEMLARRFPDEFAPHLNKEWLRMLMKMASSTL